MAQPKYTRTELAHTVAVGDTIQVVTPFIAGVGILTRLDDYTMVLEPLDEPTKDLNAANPPKEKMEDMTTKIPTTAIIALADISIIFKLKSKS